MSKTPIGVVIPWLWCIVATGIAMWVWHRRLMRAEVEGRHVLVPANLRRVLIAVICGGLVWLFFRTIDVG